jgi:probable HAF family extracellular repeat protein
MRKSHIIVYSCILLTILSGRSAEGAVISFRGIGSLELGSPSHSYVGGVSPDGSVVVGWARAPGGSNRPFRWTESGGMVDLLAGSNYTGGIATGVSIDGLFIAGQVNMRAFRWTQEGGTLILDGTGGSWSHATGISADGSVVAGWRSGPVAVRWTETDGMIDLGVPSLSLGVSGDGSVIVGGGFVWSEAGGARSIEGAAFAASWDGSVIVGRAGEGTTPRAARWTEAEGLTFLGDPPEGEYFSEATAASADGSVVVGWATTEPLQIPFAFEGEASFIWDASNGMRLLQNVLADEYRLDLTGWTLTGAFGVSSDGRVIVGTGINPAGRDEGWIAIIPEPSLLPLLALATAELFRPVVRRPS